MLPDIGIGCVGFDGDVIFPNLLSCCCDQTQQREEGFVLSYPSRSRLITERSQSRNPRQKPATETTKEYCLVPDTFLIRPRLTSLGRDPLPSISNQENDPQTRPQASLMETNPQLRVPLPRCVRPTTETSYMFYWFC